MKTAATATGICPFARLGRQKEGESVSRHLISRLTFGLAGTPTSAMLSILSSFKVLVSKTVLIRFSAWRVPCHHIPQVRPAAAEVATRKIFPQVRLIHVLQCQSHRGGGNSSQVVGEEVGGAEKRK